MVRVLPNQRFQPQSLRELRLFFLQKERHGSATLHPFNRLDSKLSLPIRFPTNSVCCVQVRAPGFHHYFVRNNKRGVETDPELANQLRVLLVISGHLLQKVSRP